MKVPRRLLPVVLVLLVVLPAAAAQQREKAGLPAMVVLVRHGEKASDGTDNPPLSAEGAERAKALAATLEHSGVSAIITTEWRRTQETAASLSSSLKIAPETVPSRGIEMRAHAKAVAEAVRRHPGQVVLVVGHSDTVPEIAAALGVPRPAPICDSVFDDLFVLVPAGGEWRLVRARYGATSPRTGCK